MAFTPTPAATDLVRIDLAVEGMTCSACSNQIQRQLGKIDGIAEARVNFANGRATILHDGSVPSGLLTSTIEGLGYTVPVVPDNEAASLRRVTELRRRLVVAVLFGLPVVLISMIPALHFAGWRWVVAALSLPVIFG
ncbi:MAG: cation transporter, partial [Acidimicrobiales bacterium]